MGDSFHSISFFSGQITIIPETSNDSDYLGRAVSLSQFAGEQSLSLSQSEQTGDYYAKRDDGVYICGRETHPDQPKLVEAAREIYGHSLGDDLEIDDDARISEGEDGDWVQAWVWVPRIDQDDDEAVKLDEFDGLVRKFTAFRNAQELLNADGNYRPSLDVSESEEHLRLADLYDEAQERRGDPRRAFRYGETWKTIYAYTNTSSMAGRPLPIRIDCARVIRAHKWNDINGNPSYGYLMDDGTTYLMQDDYAGANKITCPIKRVDRRKDLVNF